MNERDGDRHAEAGPVIGYVITMAALALLLVI